MKTVRTACAIVLLHLAGCAINSPPYQADFEVVNHLKDMNVRPAGVQDFSEADPKLNKVSLRGSPMESTYESSYGEYLEHALIEQLQHAELYEPDSVIQISGILLENDVSASGFSIGTAKLAARFVITVDGKEVYSEVHQVYHEWESSFSGAVAIPNAQNNYSVAVKNLVADFLYDERVLAILRQP